MGVPGDFVKGNAGYRGIDNFLPQAHGKIETLLCTKNPIITQIELIDRREDVNVFLLEKDVHFQEGVADRDQEENETTKRTSACRQACNLTCSVNLLRVRLAELVIAQEAIVELPGETPTDII